MKISQLFNLLSEAEEHNYLIYDYSIKETIKFTYKEICFILNEFDFEIKNISLYGVYDDTYGEYNGDVNVLLYLKNNNDLTEILRLKQKKKK